MIGRIQGKLVEIDNQQGLIETKAGIFFNVFLPKTLQLPASLNNEVSLYTYLQLRDDQPILYGFLTKDEYRLFLDLINVDSIGPKTAFNIISAITPDQLINAVKENNIAQLTTIPGLGKKTALKIIVELAQKFKEKVDLKKINFTKEDSQLIEALKTLGYKISEMKKIITQVPANLILEDRIKKALQMLK